MLFMESNKYFCKNEHVSYREINERSISNPTLGVNKLRLFRNDMTKNILSFKCICRMYTMSYVYHDI